MVGWSTAAKRTQEKQTEPKKHCFGPMVSPGLYRAYRPIYEQLSLLPRHRPRRITTQTEASSTAGGPEDPYKIFFHVWKTGGPVPFSKRSPPLPDFRIAVSDTGFHSLPSLEEITALLESTPLSEPSSNPAWTGPGRLYQRLKHGHRNVLVAIVDRGLVNYMRFGEGAFGEERLYERHDERKTARGGGGKRGGRGRGRGGRGRGRGK
ncbi:hypothetical protein NQ176_g5107 [Zarea fungicola]|uniref:Uncharacterized protein n=1 Tax=Zarea fungicola TaxID=93591 RepID=A0ACC1NCK3_9HYPO|nr:hypothetical protein NQ176_g5107 [Lecanicillium fungicola]